MSQNKQLEICKKCSAAEAVTDARKRVLELVAENAELHAQCARIPMLEKEIELLRQERDGYRDALEQAMKKNNTTMSVL